MNGRIAALLLLAWAVGHYAYHLAPLEYEGHAWNVGQAIARTIVLGVIVSLVRSPLVHIPAAGLLFEEVQVIGCTVAYVVDPWPILPGQSKCSAGLGIPLGGMGATALIWCCLWILEKLRGGSNELA